ncbi:hypothetical protein GMST_03300 [Geomonas silvestris]|uniref:Uncharacterized protein n=1 Tax=Geomonas silvestris TaxID=2740184 RepID=A0A6V8MDD0_9BACT|nr:hypothetical protein [Geomonas silvestris]GFO58005.1 hypothetical protein GMST_03300 [Geomonas silvestris]
MSNAANNLSIYLIVLCNALCHVMLIWRLRLDLAAKLKFWALCAGIPLAVMVTMRLMVALGMIPARVAEQGMWERATTLLGSVLLLAGPFLATGAALMYRRRSRLVAAAS